MKGQSIDYTIARIMSFNGRSIFDIMKALDKIPPEEKFDFAVESKGKISRMPVNDMNIKLNVVGIFPFKDDERYLELGETDVVVMKDKLKDEVPTLDDFRKLSFIILPLNTLIERIGGIPMTGCYHTVTDFGGVRRCYPYYTIDVISRMVNASFDHGELRAKIRRFINP